MHTPETFTPTFFIGIGRTSAYFTLRETFLHESNSSEGVSYSVLSFHHVNLAQDADEALAKAEEYAKNMGMELRTNERTLAEQMREIKQASEYDRAWAEAKEINDDLIATQKRRMHEQALKDVADTGIYPIGAHVGTSFADAPIRYINWIATEQFEDDSVLQYVAELVRIACADKMLPVLVQGHVGEPKQRRDFDVTVVGSFSFDGFYGRTYITTMADDNNQCLMIKSGAFSANVGDTLKIKATIKEHDNYNGQDQTIIQRVKVLGE